MVYSTKFGLQDIKPKTLRRKSQEDQFKRNIDKQSLQQLLVYDKTNEQKGKPIKVNLARNSICTIKSSYETQLQGFHDYNEQNPKSSITQHKIRKQQEKESASNKSLDVRKAYYNDVV